jgi:hypothetical protein
MKKLFVSALLVTAFSAVAFAQKGETYSVVVSFNSMCCGVPSDTPLVKMIKAFKKQYKIKQVTAYKIGPMGREGEYYLAFRLKEFSKAQKVTFIQQLKKTVPAMKDRGSAEIKENETISKADLSSSAAVTTVKL